MESAHRTSLAKGEVGRREKEYPDAKGFFYRSGQTLGRRDSKTRVPRIWFWYRTWIRALTAYKPFANAHLNEITGELASGFAAHRLTQGMAVSTANYSLRVLRVP
jgi:hypothetical protein